MRWGFRIAGLANVVGIPFFSLAFTSGRLGEIDPAFSRFGLALLVLWGLANLAAADVTGRPGALLAGVFALERLLHAARWIGWMQGHASELPALYVDAPLAAVFYAIYGPVDLAFGVFFGRAAALRWRG